jgi:hypothetical protein
MRTRCPAATSFVGSRKLDEHIMRGEQGVKSLDDIRRIRTPYKRAFGCEMVSG